jgi:hypothetical protein
MGNGNITGEKKEQQKQKLTRSESKQLDEVFVRKKTDDLVFYACTDKARV